MAHRDTQRYPEFAFAFEANQDVAGRVVSVHHLRISLRRSGGDRLSVLSPCTLLFVPWSHPKHSTADLLRPAASMRSWHRSGFRCEVNHRGTRMGAR
jgi:hypothetical protein